MKKTIAAFSLVSASVLLADPAVTSVTLSQADDHTVTISYQLSGAPAVVTLDIKTNATGNVWESIGGENIQYVTGDVNKRVSGKETYTITWRPDFSWQGNLANVQAEVTAWPLDNTPKYMVVDLLASGGIDSVRYYTSTNFLPGGLLANRKYRTTSLVMRKILAKGVKWRMGSGSSDTSRVADKEYQHPVTLTNNYYIGVFEVTQAQWALVQSGKGNATPSAFSLEAYKAMRPVESVSYNEIRMADNSTSAHTDALDWPNPPYSGSFLGRLCAKFNNEIDFDLPSDAEWEFACRAEHGDNEWNNGSTYNSSSTLTSTEPGRHKDNGGKDPGSSNRSMVDDTQGTATCGSFAPSTWGLYDMHGNVGEWCLDWYQADLTGTDGSVVGSGTQRVRRSGLASDASLRHRCAARVSNVPTLRNHYIGLRLACRAGLK